MFHFTHESIFNIHTHLDLPLRLKLVGGARVSSLESVCIMQNRHAYPNRLKTSEAVFGRQFTILSKVVRVMSNKVYKKYKHKMKIEEGYMTQETAAQFKVAVADVGSPL